jgi:hypothetical protein
MERVDPQGGRSRRVAASISTTSPTRSTSCWLTRTWPPAMPRQITFGYREPLPELDSTG